MPDRLLPMLAGGMVVLLALPIFALAGWRLSGWGLGAVLWAATQAFGLLLARARRGMDNLGGAGVLAFGMMFRAIALMVALVAIAVNDARLALSAAVVYALAYTLELGFSLLSYFSGSAR